MLAVTDNQFTALKPGEAPLVFGGRRSGSGAQPNLGNYATFKHGNTCYIMYAANSVAAGGDYATGYATSDKPLGPYKKAANNPIIFRTTASGGNVTTTGHNCFTLSPDGTEMFTLYGAVVRTNTPGAAGVTTTAPSSVPSSGPPTNGIPILMTNADGVVSTNGFRRRPGFGGGGRVLFLDRLEIKPDGALVAHSPTVTPQPYPSSGKTASP